MTTTEQIANRYAVKRYGRSAFAMRTTGTPALSGYFQTFRPFGANAATSIGCAFHVATDGQITQRHEPSCRER